MPNIELYVICENSFSGHFRYLRKKVSCANLIIKVSEVIKTDIERLVLLWLKKGIFVIARENAPHQARKMLKIWIRVEKNWPFWTKGHGLTRMFSWMK